MSKASDKVLGELHGKLADSMLKALSASDTAIMLLDEFGDELPMPVITFLTQHAEANPSLLTSIAKFLKDNNITCSIEDSESMSALGKTLASKPKRSVGNVTQLHPSE